MKIYTKAGDDGTTGILAGRRVPKSDPRVSAYGTIDELNAILGFARTFEIDERAAQCLATLQNELFTLGSALADPSVNGPFHHLIDSSRVEELERTIDALELELGPLTQFILPGGHPAAAQIQIARTVCRRAERLVVALGRMPDEDVPPALLAYLNRLGDLLFVLARFVNRKAGYEEIVWNGPRASSNRTSFGL